jgi:hypothetical protein
MAKRTAEEETTEEGQDEGPRQSVRLMAEDISPDVGPYFPSGMSAPEAALAGATANMTDDQLEQVREHAGLQMLGSGEAE